MSKIKQAPVVFTGLVQALLLAILVLLRVFGVFTPTVDQQDAIMAVYVAIVAVSMFLVYGLVTPVVNIPDVNQVQSPPVVPPKGA